MIWLGIDPGASGGIAAIGNVESLGVAATMKMPATERDVWDVLNRFSSSETFAVIEAVSAMPGNGVSSMFKFGVGYGGLRMALIAAGIPFIEVRPTVWQKSLGCLSHGDKNRTKRMAQQLFPELKITHAVADALLIAEFARRYWVQNNGAE